MLEKLRDRMARSSWEIAEAERRMCAQVGPRRFYGEWAGVVIGSFAIVFGAILAFIVKASAMDWTAVQPWATFDVPTLDVILDTWILAVGAGLFAVVHIRYYRRIGRRHREVLKAVRGEPNPKGW